VPGQYVGFLFFPVGICVGLIVAWWREGLGGAITVSSLLIFYAIHVTTATEAARLVSSGGRQRNGCHHRLLDGTPRRMYQTSVPPNNR